MWSGGRRKQMQCHCKKSRKREYLAVPERPNKTEPYLSVWRLFVTLARDISVEWWRDKNHCGR